MYTQLGLYIDGKWNHGNGGGGEDVINHATQKPLGHLPHATKSDLDAALASAQAGFKLWKFSTWFNEKHQLWAWLSLFSVGFTDFYIRMCASGTWDDPRLI